MAKGTLGAEAYGRYLIAGTRSNPVILDNRTSFGYYQTIEGGFRLFRVDEDMWQKWVDGEVITVKPDKGITWYPGFNSDNGADVVDTFRKMYELDKSGNLPGPADSAVWGFRDFNGSIELITI